MVSQRRRIQGFIELQQNSPTVRVSGEKRREKRELKEIFPNRAKKRRESTGRRRGDGGVMMEIPAAMIQSGGKKQGDQLVRYRIRDSMF